MMRKSGLLKYEYITNTVQTHAAMLADLQNRLVAESIPCFIKTVLKERASSQYNNGLYDPIVLIIGDSPHFQLY
ncbi:hypothetical protein Pan161_46530 [Gimesia algae]|uniref:Uncharacterized protein n=1 Tax=Gimesia algae TaxID=2527971 RepID=A0A517VJ06_9PLAN|nr:hypothetical protein Pan161_46530 [Gimesia algae]